MPPARALAADGLEVFAEGTERAPPPDSGFTHVSQSHGKGGLTSRPEGPREGKKKEEEGVEEGGLRAARVSFNLQPTHLQYASPPPRRPDKTTPHSQRHDRRTRSPLPWSFSRGRAAENLGLGAVSGNGFPGCDDKTRVGHFQRKSCKIPMIFSQGLDWGTA